LYKGATNQDYLMSDKMGVGQKAASTLMKGIMSKSSALSTGLGMLAGAVTPATAAMMALSWAAEQAINALVEGFKAMQTVQRTAAFRTNLTTDGLTGVRSDFNEAAASLNKETTGNNFIKRITAAETLTTMSKVITEFKDMGQAQDKSFIRLALGLEEMGYDISGGVGEIIKAQYYRNEKKMDSSNDLLNKLVGLSKTSSLSLDELVSIMSATTTEQNLNAWTLMRGGMSSADATARSLEFGKSKAAIAGAADTMGITQTGVDAIYSIMSEIISSATDPTKLGDLTKKYVVGGMTGGKSITDIYSLMSAGKFTDVFKIMLGSAATVGQSSQAPGFEYLSSQFGSQISTILGSFGPSTVTEMLTKIDTMTAEMSKEQPAVLDTIAESIANSPITIEDILNSFFDQFFIWGQGVADLLQKIANPFGDSSKNRITNANGNKENVDKSITQTMYDSAVAKQKKATPPPTAATQLDMSNYNRQIHETVMSNLTSNIATAPPGGSNSVALKDYYISDTEGWFNNDIRGSDPFQITAGFMSPAYKKAFNADHTGVDYGARVGTPIPSAVDGVVVAVGYDSVSGNYVKVQDDSGRIHSYGHMSQTSVKKGDRVTMGTTLGLVGATGKATGPHVHYQVTENGKPINPSPWAGNSFAGLYKNQSMNTATMDPATTRKMDMINATGASGISGSNINMTGRAVSTGGTYYGSSDVVNSITELNLMLSRKLDIVIEKMGKESGLKSQFNYVNK
jgi:murein DD-endopeptidase MepM/ murein hydrolase activator NlpD